MSSILYILVIFIATGFGALAGIGGGVLFKPVLDAFGEYSAAQISVVSSCAVFAMSCVSVAVSARQIKEQKSRLKMMLPLAVGAVCGGWLGEYIFSGLTGSDALIRVIQNLLLLILIILVVIYMKNENKRSLNRNEWYIAILTGLALGAVSAFLGVGGGPMNVALLTLVFGFEIKTAVIGSLLTILFAQGTKLLIMAVRDASVFRMMLLPFAVLAGVCGALLGRALNKKASDKTVNNCFIAVQLLIIALCLFNIVKYINGFGI